MRHDVAEDGVTADDELVKVARASNQAEAEFLQDLLRQEGVPSVLRRTRGFDVPDFLAAGPRDVLVAASQSQSARDALLAAGQAQPAVDGDGRDSPLRVLVLVLVVVAVVALLAWLGTAVLG